LPGRLPIQLTLYCRNAALPGLLAQVNGKAGADLCALPCYVNFKYALEECRRCLVKRNSPQTVVIDAIPQYQQFVSFCSGYLTSTTPGQCYSTSTATGRSLQTTTSSASTYASPLTTFEATTEVITWDILSTTFSPYSSVTYPSVPSIANAEGYVTTTTVSTISGPLVTVTTVKAGSTLTVTEAKTVFDIQVLSIKSVPAPSGTQAVVVCPSRTTNTAYSPSAPLPKNYTWGCPPGLVCVPSEAQDDCNYELGLPDEGYICSPDECLIAPVLRAVDSLQPITGNLFYPNPALFGLSYQIFLAQVLTTSIVIMEKGTSTYSTIFHIPSNTILTCASSSVGKYYRCHIYLILQAQWRCHSRYHHRRCRWLYTSYRSHHFRGPAETTTTTCATRRSKRSRSLER
jgi:hypothetical protein